MNKNILAIAIAAAVAAPSAFAAATVYGNAHMSINSVSGVGNNTTVANSNDSQSITNVTSNSSYLGVKGSEDLGSGMKAVYQMEFGVNMDSEAQTSGLGGATRNTFVGLGGGFGTVLVGRHDSPIKMVGRKFDLFGDQTGNNRNILGSGDTNLVDGRHSNVLAYQTPTFSGFQALLAYVPGAGRDNEYGSGEQVGAGEKIKARDALSANLMYKIGGFEAGLGLINIGNVFTNQTDGTPAVTYAKSYNAYRLGAGYTFGAAKVVGLYQLADYDDVDENTNTASGKIRSRGAFGLGGSYKVTTAGTVKAQYYIADNTKGAKDGANMITVGYDHALSKNTTVYALYATVDNNREGAFTTNMANAGTNDNTVAYNPATGSSKDNSAFSVGVQHKF